MLEGKASLGVVWSGGQDNELWMRSESRQGNLRNCDYKSKL